MDPVIRSSLFLISFIFGFASGSLYAQSQIKLKDTVIRVSTSMIHCSIRGEKLTDPQEGFHYVDSIPNIEINCLCSSMVKVHVVDSVTDYQMQGLLFIDSLCGTVTIGTDTFVRVVYQFVDDEYTESELGYVLVGNKGLVCQQKLIYDLSTYSPFSLVKSKEEFLKGFSEGNEKLAESEYEGFRYIK